MHSSSLIKSLFFKKDVNGELKINIGMSIIVIFVLIYALIFLRYAVMMSGSSIYEESTILQRTFFNFAVCCIAPFYILFSIFRKDNIFSNLNTNKIAVFAFVFSLIRFYSFYLIHECLYFDSIVICIILSAIIAGSVFIFGYTMLPVKTIANNVIRKNYFLHFVIGYLLIFISPILGIIMGVYICTRKDNEYANRYGLFIIGTAIIILVISFFFNLFLPAAVHYTYM